MLTSARPEKSTRAYARYMKFIYNQLGDWYLSMAAYDTAPQHSACRAAYGYADFWSSTSATTCL